MTLLQPQWLLLLLPVAALVVAYLRLQRRRHEDIARFANPELFARIATERPGPARHLAVGAVGLSLVTLVLGLARPAHDVQVPRKQAIVMLAIDVSASMSATDVSPDRLDAAIQTAKEFVQEIPPRYKVGLIAFDDNPRVLATPTIDHAAVIDAISQLQLGRGTAAGEALATALQTIDAALQSSAPGEAATIVLLSDGATTVGRPVEVAAQEAADQHVPVSTIAFGTDHGIVQVQGRLIRVPADPAAMQSVADITGGKSFEAASIDQLRSVYKDVQGRITTTTQQRTLVGGFVAGGLAVLVAGVGLALAARGVVL